MIEEYVNDIANQLGIRLTKVSIAGGLAVSCIDYRLEIASKNHVVTTMIRQSELDSIEKASCSGFLELKIRTALDRLNTQIAA